MKSRPEKSEALAAATDRASMNNPSDTNHQENSVSNSTLIPVFTGTLSNCTVQLCDARTLHAFMQVRRDFTTWIKGRIRKFGFTVGEDYATISRSPELGSGKEVFTKSGENLGGRPGTDYHLTLDMAKELAMVENNEQGRAARRYFIECERRALAAASPASPAIDNERIALAEAVAAEAVTRVYHAVFSAVMAGGEWWAHDRYLLSLRYDQSNKPTIPIARPFASGEMVVSMDKLPDMINGSDPVSCTDLQLARLAMACAKRQEFRAERRAEREGAQKQTPLHAMPAATKAIGGAA